MADLPSSGELSSATLTVGGFKTLIEDLRNSASQGLTTFQLGNTYESGSIVVTANSVLYVSQVGSNAGNSPSTDDGSNWLAPPFLNYRGEWSDISGALYKGMAVMHNGGLWVASVDIPTASASEPLSSNSNYNVYIQPRMFDYVVSQYAEGIATDVGYISVGVDVTDYSYLIWPDDGRVYSVDSVTGTITAAFDPDDGSDAGLSGNLVNVNSQIATAAEITAGTERKVVMADELAGSEFGLGVNQSYVSVTRTASVTYTNSTGKPIFVVVTISAGNNVSFTVDGDNIAPATGSAATRATYSFVIPNESTYSYTGATSAWWELR